MANIINEQKIIDNSKRALIKYVWKSDGTAEANTVLIDVSNLGNAMNANNGLMVANTHPKGLYRTTIKRIFGSVKANTRVELQWQGTGNSSIVALASGSPDINFEINGDVAVISNPYSDSGNTNGDILLTVPTPNSGDCFTLFIDLRKDNRDYSAGQHADPTAFNRGPAAM